MFSILEVPFHLGLEEVAVGKGPARLIRAGADQTLATDGMPAGVTHIRPRDSTTGGLDAVVDLGRQLSAAVREAVEQGAIPVVLAGNCNSCLATLAGLQGERLGIVWLDAHPDFHTPATSRSGFLDGMALAAAAGHCQQELCERIGLADAIEERNIVLAGVRDVEDGERERLEESWVSVHAADSLGLLPVALEQLAQRVDAVYLHIDLDFLDPEDSPGVNFRGPGGVPIDNAEQLVRLVASTVAIRAVALTNYNPDLDVDDRSAGAALRLLSALRPSRVQ